VAPRTAADHGHARAKRHGMPICTPAVLGVLDGRLVFGAAAFVLGLVMVSASVGDLQLAAGPAGHELAWPFSAAEQADGTVPRSVGFTARRDPGRRLLNHVTPNDSAGDWHLVVARVPQQLLNSAYRRHVSADTTDRPVTRTNVWRMVAIMRSASGPTSGPSPFP
jgi:hypothetical protein